MEGVPVKRDLGVVAFGLALCVTAGCALPRLFTPQSDIEGYVAVYGSGEHSLLVASRSSAFKDAVVEGIDRAFAGESVAIKFVGLQKVKYEDAGDFDTVVIINTCIAWGMDPQVDGYLNKYSDASNIIVLTTSGAGDWLPKKQNRTFDAVASASEMMRVDEVTAEIVEKVRGLMGI